MSPERSVTYVSGRTLLQPEADSNVVRLDIGVSGTLPHRIWKQFRLEQRTELEAALIRCCLRNSEFISEINSVFFSNVLRATDDSAQPAAASRITETLDF